MLYETPYIVAKCMLDACIAFLKLCLDFCRYFSGVPRKIFENVELTMLSRHVTTNKISFRKSQILLPRTKNCQPVTGAIAIRTRKKGRTGNDEGDEI